MAEIQQMLFEETETDKLKRELNAVKEQLSNLRKGLFKRHDRLATEIFRVQEDVYALKKNAGMQKDDGAKVFELSFF